MHRQLTSEFVLLSLVVRLIHSKEYVNLYCPNYQIPEVDRNGIVKHCLPGREELCGSGYSCYFSGTNYQCCPTEEEINSDSILECPSPSITILTDAGLPLICTPGLHDCPQSSMHCLEVGKHSICCEGLSASIETASLLGLNSHDETIQPVESNNKLRSTSNLECPEPAFTILDGNGDPVPCSEEDCAHQSGRFCYKPSNIAICCEGEERTVDDDTLIKKILRQNKHEKEGRIGWSALRYTPLTTAQRQLQRNEILHNDNRLGSDVLNIEKLANFDESIFEIKQDNLRTVSPTATQTITQSEETQITTHPSVIFNAETSRTITTTLTTSETVKTTDTTTTPTITLTTGEPDLFGQSGKKIQHQSTSLLPGKSQPGRGTIRYKPHNAGGYAISQSFSSKIRRAPNDLRALAREYLLEHIRRGWPYSDEFYRSYSPSDHQSQEGEIFHEET
uniref:Uncharacterized protein n=1 Tax=Setaria digitata TaxID=48799 RepID=A0A915PDK8_9BILA